MSSYGRREGGYGGRGGGYSGGGYRSGGFGGGPKPVEVGKEYDVQITETSRKGDGIARVQGFVIFVVGGKVGHKVKIKITNIGARFATAEIVSSSSAVEGTNAGQVQGTAAEKQKEDQDMSPQTSEQEKPELQAYKSKAGEEQKPPEA